MKYVISFRLKFCISESRLMFLQGAYPIWSNCRAHKMGPDLQQQQHTYLSRRICTLSCQGGKRRLVLYIMKYGMSLRLSFCISLFRLMFLQGMYPIWSNCRAHEMGPDLQQQQHTYLSRRICTLSWRGGKGRLVLYIMKYGMSLRLRFCISLFRLMFLQGMYPIWSNCRAHEMGPDLQQQQHTYLSRRICTLSWRGGKGRLVFYIMKYEMFLQLKFCISESRLMFLQCTYPVRSKRKAHMSCRIYTLSCREGKEDQHCL